MKNRLLSVFWCTQTRFARWNHKSSVVSAPRKHYHSPVPIVNCHRARRAMLFMLRFFDFRMNFFTTFEIFFFVVKTSHAFRFFVLFLAFFKNNAQLCLFIVSFCLNFLNSVFDLFICSFLPVRCVFSPLLFTN